jgi:hypothetical protein
MDIMGRILIWRKIHFLQDVARHLVVLGFGFVRPHTSPQLGGYIVASAVSYRYSGRLGEVTLAEDLGSRSNRLAYREIFTEMPVKDMRKNHKPLPQ